MPRTPSPSSIDHLEDAIRAVVGPIRDLETAQQSHFERLEGAVRAALESPSRQSRDYGHHVSEVLEPILHRITEYRKALPAFDPHLLGYLREVEVEERTLGSACHESAVQLRDCLTSFLSIHLASLQALERVSDLHRRVAQDIELRFQEMREAFRATETGPGAKA